jgi:hypothetical protein
MTTLTQQCGQQMTKAKLVFAATVIQSLLRLGALKQGGGHRHRPS